MKSKGLFFLFAFMVLIWGANFPINKIGLSFTSATNYVEWRLIIATCAIFLIVLMTRQFVLPRKIDLPIIIAVGVFQMGFTLIFTNYGLSLTETGKASFIVYTTPIWIILITGILNRRMTFFDAIGLCVGLVGTILLVNPFKFRLHDYSSWAGECSLILAALAWSIGIVFTRRLTWHRSPLKLLFWQILTGTLMTVFYAICQGVSLVPDSVNLILLSSLLYAGILSTAVGYWLMVILSKALLPAVTSFGLLFVPIVALTLSCLFLNESLTIRLSLSVLLILIGILFHIYSEVKRHNRKKDVL